jgi:hypothetical protein
MPSTLAVTTVPLKSWERKRSLTGTHGPSRDIGRRWGSAEVGTALRALIAQAPAPEPVYGTA